jgi:hypothetical protein
VLNSTFTRCRAVTDLGEDPGALSLTAPTPDGIEQRLLEAVLGLGGALAFGLLSSPEAPVLVRPGGEGGEGWG